MRLALVVDFGAHQPEVIHPLATHRAEPRDYSAARTVCFCRMACSIGPHNRLSHFGSRVVASLDDFAQRAAHADRLIDGRAGAAA